MCRWCCPFEEDTPAELLHTYAPIFLLRAAIIKKEDIVGRESVDEVEVLSFKEGYSTSDIVKKIAMMAKEGIMIIVTGGAGFIGSNIVKAFKRTRSQPIF